MHAGLAEYKEGDMTAHPPPADLAEALAVIARQAEEIERLRLRQADARLAEDLRAALIRSALAGTIATPVTHSRLLEMIVETAAQVISSQAASLFLVDEERRELVFEIALGQKAEEVKKFRVPLGHGIAGHVAATGQPTATSGTVDPRQAREIGESVGYVPRTILCVPLFYADRVIGVLELLDKADEATFTMLDMHVLGLFANMAAVALATCPMPNGSS
jgi:signal transduction protein with GAF and PtsI domain